ncbi:MAG: hypothetical protein DRQ99_05905, partial [Candidatus Parabeggiatoa sp. nov. 3]
RDARHRVSTNATNQRREASRLYQRTRDARYRVSTNATNQRREASRLYQRTRDAMLRVSTNATNQRREASRLYQCNEPETRGIASLYTIDKRIGGKTPIQQLLMVMKGESL